jgi:hypothetical protein
MMRIGFTGCTACDVEVLAHTTLKSVPATKVGRMNLPIERFKFNVILSPEFLPIPMTKFNGSLDDDI